MPDLAGKSILITGANTGIGRATAQALAERGASLTFAGRSEAKTRAVIDEIAERTGNRTLRFVPLDLCDLGSIRACARTVLATNEPLHVLINNAGLAGHRGMTDSGFELMFGTDYVGPFLLTALLLERLKESAPARIVNVASDAHYSAKGIDYEAIRQPTKSVTGMREYSVAKLGNVLHARELARRLGGTGVTSYALHPGVIASDIWRRVPWPIRPLIKLRMRSPEDGAQTPLYCATAPELADESGHYYESCARKQPSRVVTPELAAELWERTSEWVGAPAPA
jgi:NAD(P)-dependent dehydrogenase (short-subunit alcohol dehydrogenase family)